MENYLAFANSTLKYRSKVSCHPHAKLVSQVETLERVEELQVSSILDKSRLLAIITLTKAYRQLNLICKTKTWGIFEGAVE